MKKLDTDLSWTEGLDRNIQRSRLDCFMFFYVSFLGWGPTKIVERPNNQKSFYSPDCPVSKIRALGYPQTRRILTALQRLKRKCPEEVSRYRTLLTDYKEARRRWTATLYSASWQQYLEGTGKWNSLAYQSVVQSRRKGQAAIFKKKYFKYDIWEILPRKQEQKRAWGEIRQIQLEMLNVRNAIFDKMEVPEQYRRLC